MYPPGWVDALKLPDERRYSCAVEVAAKKRGFDGVFGLAMKGLKGSIDASKRP